MRRAGEVVRTAQGLAVVRVPEPEEGRGNGDGEGSADYPAIGTELVDESLATVGEVVDVFGPVRRPYLAVSPDDDPAPLLGRPVYER